MSMYLDMCTLCNMHESYYLWAVTHIHMHTYAYTHAHAHTHTHMRIYTYTHTHAHPHTHAWMHVYTHAHAHRSLFLLYPLDSPLESPQELGSQPTTCSPLWVVFTHAYVWCQHGWVTLTCLSSREIPGCWTKGTLRVIKLYWHQLLPTLLGWCWNPFSTLWCM